MATELDMQTAESIVEILEENNFEAELRESYSGRGMYGATCIGIVTDAPMTVVGWACGMAGLALEGIPRRTDSMGLSTIVY